MAYYKGASFRKISPFLFAENTKATQRLHFKSQISSFVSVKVTDSLGLPASSLESANQSPPMDWRANKDTMNIFQTNPNVKCFHNLSRLQLVESMHLIILNHATVWFVHSICT